MAPELVESFRDLQQTRATSAPRPRTGIAVKTRRTRNRSMMRRITLAAFGAALLLIAIAPAIAEAGIKW
jgi:hypothetical protein